MASKEDKPLGSELPSIDSGELVEVCELFSPTHFYVHWVEDRGKVDRMMRKAHGMSVDRRHLWLNPAEVKLGMMVAARWGEEGWHRVKVVGFLPSKVELRWSMWTLALGEMYRGISFSDYSQAF